MGATAAAGAALDFVSRLTPLPISTAMTAPTGTLSPAFTAMLSTVPATSLGTGIDALSVSTSIRSWPAAMVSPALTFTKTTVAESIPSPRFGSLNSIFEGAADAAGSAFAGASGLGAGAAGFASAFGAAAGAGFASPLPLKVSSTPPTATLSPGFTRISPTVPAPVLDTGTEALSVSTSKRSWPAVTLSPGFTFTATTVAESMPSPSSGRTMFIMFPRGRPGESDRGRSGR
jgi:hypothetical protein